MINGVMEGNIMTIYGVMDGKYNVIHGVRGENNM